MIFINSIMKRDKIATISGTIIITLTVFYFMFWEFRDMVSKASGYINWDAFSAIGTVIAAGATFFTIRQVNQQRKDTFKPHIVLIASSYNLNFDDTKHPLDADGLHYNVSSTPAVKLINAGKGLAYDIVYNTTLDLNEFIRVLKKEDKNNEFIFEESSIGYNVFLKSNTYLVPLYHEMDYKVEHHVLINTDTVQDDHILIPLSPDYIRFVLLASYLTRNEMMDIRVLQSIPKLYYNITYTDMEKNVFNSRFEIHIVKIFSFYNLHIKHIPS